jgi:hypothetical protein
MILIVLQDETAKRAWVAELINSGILIMIWVHSCCIRHPSPLVCIMSGD